MYILLTPARLKLCYITHIHNPFRPRLVTPPFQLSEDAVVVAAIRVTWTRLPISWVHCVFLDVALRELCGATEREAMMSPPRRHTIMLGNTSQRLSPRAPSRIARSHGGRDTDERSEKGRQSRQHTRHTSQAQQRAKHAPVWNYKIEQ